MPLATLSQVLTPTISGRYAVAGLVVLGWEDARAYVRAAELEGCPIILQAGPGCRKHTPLRVLAAMFEELARSASVPVVTHLDHAESLDVCCEAIALGFTSVMFDGSGLPLNENVLRTREVADKAHEAGISCEGEIGFVGYAQGASSQRTQPDEAVFFAEQTGVDAVAVSVGNVHLQARPTDRIDRDALDLISQRIRVPIVIHGGSGLSRRLRQEIAIETKVGKINIGTELRMMFGQSVRDVLQSDPQVFDRMTILSRVETTLVDYTQGILRDLSYPSSVLGIVAR